MVEELIGARLAHCFGNTIQRPESRAVVHFALDDLRDRDSIGSMVYGNTVDHRPGDRARKHRCCRGAVEVRHRAAAATANRPRRQPRSVDRGGADPECRGDRRDPSAGA